MNYRNLLTCACSGLLLAAGQCLAEPHSITLPPETAQLKPSDHPGYQLALQKCSICHSADYINLQPPGMNLQQWTGEARKMQQAYGAPITDDDVRLIGEYLALTYGTAKPTDIKSAGKAKSAVTASPVESSTKTAAQALLGKHACLSCHAIDHQVVGPAYRQVAQRYRGQAKALETVMASIKQGGSGKWGTTPMPPFAELSAQELETLARFVLSQ